MESMLPLLIFTLLAFGVMAALIVMYVLTTRALREIVLTQQAAQREFMQTTMQTALETMKQSTQASTSSLASALSDVTTLARESQSLLASKDAISYQMIQRANHAADADSDSVGLYPASTPPTAEDVRSSRNMAAYLENMGVTPDVDYTALPANFPAIPDGGEFDPS